MPPSLRLDPTIPYHSHLWQFNCFETRVKGVGRDFKLEDSNDLVLTVFGDTNQILPSFPPKVFMGYHYQISINKPKNWSKYVDSLEILCITL